MKETAAIVLRKTVYSETSLIIVTLTETMGQQHFLLKGARRIGRRTFPEVDLFRYLNIQYRPSRTSQLHTAYNTECLHAFDSIAQCPERYQAAVWLCQLVAKNTMDGVVVADTFKALHLALNRLSQPQHDHIRAIVSAFCFIFLLEYGALPDYQDHSIIMKHIAHMKRFGLSSTAKPPQFSNDDWHALGQWLTMFFNHIELACPPGFDALFRQPS